jgi:hypothetical protein
MSEQRQHHHHECDPPADAYRGRDPIGASWIQTGSVDRALLKDGERLTLLQRMGCAIISLLFVGFGLVCLRFCADEFEAGIWIFVLIFGCAAFFFLTFGTMGLRNVLRFPEKP